MKYQWKRKVYNNPQVYNNSQVFLKISPGDGIFIWNIHPLKYLNGSLQKYIMK